MLSSQQKITLTAKTADSTPIVVEGCTQAVLPHDSKTTLEPTGTTVILKGNIVELICDNNALTALDARTMPALQKLNCATNKLQSLDVQGLAHLETLDRIVCSVLFISPAEILRTKCKCRM